MADKYSTIQQHQPLRVPAGWDKQEKALIVQLDEIFDDVYRRFGRLRIEDMGKAFQKRIENDEGDIAELILDVGEIIIDVGNKYDKVSGITINANGIGISGSKYVDIGSGCKIDVESGGDINVKNGGDINVKSGGSLNVNSGGNIDINGTGNLKLSGSTVEIKSGSTFDVESTNFSISTVNKRMICGNWTFGDLGASLELLDGFELRIAGNNAYIGSDIAVSTYVYRNTWSHHPTWWSWGYGFYASLIDNGTIIDRGTIGFKYIGTTGAEGWALARIEAYSDDVNYTIGEYYNEFSTVYANKIRHGYHANYLNIENFLIGGGKLYYDGAWNPSGSIGIADHKFEYGYINTIYYGSLIQNSSKEIKHDIHPLPSVGEKLDQLKPVTFVYDDDPNENQRMGLIYEDAVEVMPEICTGDEGNKAINYVELIPALLKEIQDLRARVKALEEREEE